MTQSTSIQKKISLNIGITKTSLSIQFSLYCLYVLFRILWSEITNMMVHITPTIFDISKIAIDKIFKQ